MTTHGTKGDRRRQPRLAIRKGQEEGAIRKPEGNWRPKTGSHCEPVSPATFFSSTRERVVAHMRHLTLIPHTTEGAELEEPTVDVRVTVIGTPRMTVPTRGG